MVARLSWAVYAKKGGALCQDSHGLQIVQGHGLHIYLLFLGESWVVFDSVCSLESVNFLGCVEPRNAKFTEKYADTIRHL